jgi:hypothetical protein
MGSSIRRAYTISSERLCDGPFVAGVLAIVRVSLFEMESRCQACEFEFLPAATAECDDNHRNKFRSESQEVIF